MRALLSSSTDRCRIIVIPFRIISLLLVIALILIVCIPDVLALAAPKRVSQARRQRSVDKARAKLHEFASQQQQPQQHQQQLSPTKTKTVLVVDGNNVRGIGQCAWSSVEWMEGIAKLCQAYEIDHHVVVWDHGPAAIVLSPSPDAVCLFAGLSQRADDVMVQEASHLRDCLCGHSREDTTSDGNVSIDEGGNDNDKQQQHNFHNLCFVTNDGGLHGRLRQLGSDPRLRVFNTNGPMVLDATRFIELVKEVYVVDKKQGGDLVDNNNNNELLVGTNNECLHRSMKIAEGQLAAYAVAQQKKYNPRRELTWQRCVLGDAMVRGYSEQQQQQPASVSTSAIGASSIYTKAAQRERGLQTLPRFGSASEEGDSRVVSGSMRLDKKQKRELARYNKMWS